MNSVKRLPTSLKQALGLVAASGRPLLFTVVALIAISAALVAAELVLIRSVVDELSTGSAALAGLVGFSMVAALRRLTTVVLHESNWLISERVDQTVMRDVLRIATDASYEEFELPEFQDSLARAINAAKHQVWAASDGLLRTLRSALTLIVLAIVLIAIVPELLFPFALAGLGLGVVSAVKSQLTYSFAYHETAPDRERRYLREALVSRSEGREMRLFGTSSMLRDRYDGLVIRRIEHLLVLLRKRLLADLASSIGLSLVLAGCLVYIGREVAAERVEFGAAAVAALTAYQLIGALSGLFNGAGTLLEASQHVDDLRSFLRRPSIPAETVLDSAPKSIVLSDVSYRYPESNRDALHGIDLELSAGEVVAVVGENGSGKSTLARVLLGLYRPTTGSVEVFDSADTPVPVTGPLVDHATATFQDFARYEVSVLENLTLGSRVGDQLGHDALTATLAAAQLTDVVAALPDGADTRLGRRFANGLDLSVGQWQRLALARAMVNRRATFVVLDEPTSALDPLMEHATFDEVRSNFNGKGVLLISHRLASLDQADRIVVLDDGEIAEQGTHSELVALGGLYAAMRARQASRFTAT